MTCARGKPVSPEHIHEAAVDVWMFLLIWSLNWQFEGSEAREQAHSRRFLEQQQRHSKQPFCRGNGMSKTIVPSEDWATLLKTAKVDNNGEEIKLAEAITCRPNRLARRAIDRSCRGPHK